MLDPQYESLWESVSKITHRSRSEHEVQGRLVALEDLVGDSAPKEVVRTSMRFIVRAMRERKRVLDVKGLLWKRPKERVGKGGRRGGRNALWKVWVRSTG